MHNAIDKKTILAEAQKLATPIDFDALIGQGVLGNKKGAWYPVLDMNRLPEHAKAQITALSDGDGVKVKFSKKQKSAQKIVDKLSK